MAATLTWSAEEGREKNVDRAKKIPAGIPCDTAPKPAMQISEALAG